MNFLHHYNPVDPYPDSDGLPMAENTEQYDWLVKIKENLEILLSDRADAFVAGDLLWYPVEDKNVAHPVVAPDVMVALGRPKGRRGSYRQWEEDGIAPQVVFEILSPSNSVMEMKAKKEFYERYGVQEYYVYDPERNRLEVWMREGQHLRKMSHIGGWVSPLLNIRFAVDKQTLNIFYPSGKRFLNSVELNQYALEEQMAKEEAVLDKEAALREKEAERLDKEAALREKEAERLDKEAALREKEAAVRDKEAALAELNKLRALLAK